MLDGGLSEFVLAKGTCSQRTSRLQKKSDLQFAAQQPAMCLIDKRATAAARAQ
jgi:hypothetical protein